MLFDAPSNLAAITGPEATRDRISFFTLSVVSTAVQAGAIMTLIPLFEGLFSDNPAALVFPWGAAFSKPLKPLGSRRSVRWTSHSCTPNPHQNFQNYCPPQVPNPSPRLRT